MRRVKWKCPGCKVSYAVPDATDLVLCPDCRVEPVNNKPTRRKKQARWTLSDVAFIVVSSSVLIGLLTIIGIPVWNALKPERDPTKLAVREWLKENLEDGSWEEVKWFPPRTVQGLQDLNLLHIIEMMEADQKAFERGSSKDDRSSEYREHYIKVRDSEPRTFCALKFRTSTLNGQAKALRNQAFEIVNGKAKALRSNEIREAESSLLKNRMTTSYDGWRYFEDHDFEPFPNERIDGLERRLAAASIWKAPPEVTHVPVAPQLQPVVKINPVRQLPRPEPMPPEIPRRIREYFDREVKMKEAECAVLEKRIASFETRRRNAKPSQISFIEERIRLTNDELTEVKRKRFIASIPDHPIVGDVGALAVMEVVEAVDEHTVIARWHVNGKGRLPRLDVAIHSNAPVELKAGDAVKSTDSMYKVTATKDESSEELDNILASGRKAEFVIQEADLDEIKKWRVEYEKEMRAKK